jgi:heat shock protein HslJ
MVVAALVLSACGARDNATPEPAQPRPEPELSGDVDKASDTGGAAAPGALAGTSWQLVEFQSMDDSQGTTYIDDPSSYVMELRADGTVAMQLNCNRANGTWSAQAGAGGASGTFRFGPLAATKALCPPESFDELVTAQAEYVRAYLLRDGKLYLSLMADGGIFAWEPVVDSVAFATRPDPGLEAAILAASPDYTRKIVNAGGADRLGRYVYSLVDLDNDGDDEIFVYLLGSFFCGTGGCNLQLFTRDADGYALVNEFTTTRTPVIVTSQMTNGWKDIWRYRSGGGRPANYIAGRFDGTRYVDAEEIPADDPPVGTRVLSGEPTFEQGIPLEPAG